MPAFGGFPPETIRFPLPAAGDTVMCSIKERR
jgi:hypothetical protein